VIWPSRRSSQLPQLNSLLSLDGLSQLREEEGEKPTVCKTSNARARNQTPGSFVSSGDENNSGNGSDLGGGNSSEPSAAPRREVLTWAMGVRGNPRLAMANLSVMLLVLLTMTNLALDLIHAQMHRIDSPYDYDALSTEVIVPPFRYTLPVNDASRRPRLGLGSAAIGSLTDALSPILPFTGGVDLRRAEGLDEWCDALSSFFGSLRLPWSPFSSAFSSSASGAQPSDGNLSASGSAIRSSDYNHASYTAMVRRPILSESVPFFPLDKIAQLTLGDISTAFSYIIEANREGVDTDEVKSTLSTRTKEMALAIEEATAISRGDGINFAQTKARQSNHQEVEIGPIAQSAGYGDIDALQFCAAMRIFAEWRLLRQVPDGYKGYAVGMSLGHRDIVQNVAKIENAVHSLIDSRASHTLSFHANQQDGDDAVDSSPPIVTSPTLRELLRYEIETDINPSANLPRLREKSAAMGLLWVRRQFHYQTSIFSNILDVPEIHPTARDAVVAAYSEVYNAFHGWAVQKIFNYSFQAAPEAEVIYRFMNPEYLEKVTNAALRGETEFREEEAPHTPAQKEEKNLHDPDENDDGEDAVESDEDGDSDASDNGNEDDKEDDADASEEDKAEEEAYDINLDYVVNANNPSGVVPPYEIVNVNNGTIAAANLSAHLTMKNHQGTNKTHSDSTKTKVKKISNGNNPLLKLGAHIAVEWDKFGNQIGDEWDKLGKHVGGEWDKLGKHLNGEISKFGDEVGKISGEFDKLGKQVGGEWDKLASNVIRLFSKNDLSARSGRNEAKSVGVDETGGNKKKSIGLEGEELEQYVTHQMLLDAQKHIIKYLEIAEPLLKDLSGLFDEMNMDDPTKV